MSSRTKTIPTIALTAAAVLVVALAALGDEKGYAVAGRTALEKRCSGGPAQDHDKSGPRLARVVGRKAGAISAFPYSESAKKSCVVWSEAVLDKWLIDPETVIPDTDMARRGRTRLSETDGQIDAEDPHRS